MDIIRSGRAGLLFRDTDVWGYPHRGGYTGKEELTDERIGVNQLLYIMIEINWEARIVDVYVIH